MRFVVGLKSVLNTSVAERVYTSSGCFFSPSVCRRKRGCNVKQENRHTHKVPTGGKKGRHLQPRFVSEDS